MKTYVSVDEVDSILGADWGVDKPHTKEQAVLMANVWMTNRKLPDIEPAPEVWKLAAAEIAREAAKGSIYAQTEQGLTSKSTSAGDVSVSKSFASNHKVISAGENLALEMLKPWTGAGGFHMLKRV